MGLVAKLDDLGKPAWIGLMVLGFIGWWPIGLAILAYLLWSGRMNCGMHRGRWQERMSSAAGRWHDRWHGRHERSSGSSAFDEYRAEALRRLEDEEREFKDFLERLRHAKDKAEFDQFMAERGRRSQGPEPQPES